MSFRIFLGRRLNTHVESAIELYLELNLLQSSLTNGCEGDGPVGLDMCPWKIVADLWLCTPRSDFMTSTSLQDSPAVPQTSSKKSNCPRNHCRNMLFL